MKFLRRARTDAVTDVKLHGEQPPEEGAVALKGDAQVRQGLEATRAFVTDVYASVKSGAAAGKDLKAVYREKIGRAHV